MMSKGDKAVEDTINKIEGASESVNASMLKQQIERQDKYQGMNHGDKALLEILKAQKEIN